jgi:3'-phosphoadenosine 5'-phosphosulfate sulfotransferase (PAPS reductase)/FAD synthetase
MDEIGELPRATSDHINSQLFRSKRAHALHLIESMMRDAIRPAILSSFGKESLVLIALARELGLTAEFAYFELGLVAEKHAFARRTIDGLALNVTHLIPHYTFLIRGLTDTSLAYTFKLTSGAEFHIAITFEEGSEENLICGLDSSLQRIGSHPAYPWDILISGRRDSDVDISLGSLRWHNTVQSLEGNSAIVMPILNWTDQDVYHYLRWQQIEPDLIRYEQAGHSFRSHSDMRNNPDHAPYCIRCFAAVRGADVACPKFKRTITSFRGIAEHPLIVPNNVSPAVMC